MDGPQGPGIPVTRTEGVRTLMGDPKKAIVKLAWPMIVAMSTQTIYNVVDAIWVSGLGADALAAVGFFFPFFFLTMAIATGIGMGGSSAVSRHIGARDKEGADSVATHTIVLMLIAAVVFTLPLLIFARNIFATLGAGDTIDLVVDYSVVMFAGTVIVFFSNVSLALLRGEGDAKRPMYAMTLGAVTNIVLDPFFIYSDLKGIPGLGLGIAGAAVATMISFSISALLLLNWLFLRKDTYVSFRFRGFSFKKDVLIDIFRVGVPASVQYISMSIMMMAMNLIIVLVGGTDGVAVFTTGWRVAMMANMPLVGMSTAVVAVSGASFGMKDYQKLRTGFLHAAKLGLAIELTMIVLAFTFANQIAYIFTTADAASHIYDDLVVFLRTMCFFLPMVPFGMFSSAMFQGTGKGTYALIVTLIRTLILVVPLSYLIGVVLFDTLQGIWIGLVIANSLGAGVGFSWAMRYLGALSRGKERARAGYGQSEE
jgi:putative MATE family efflux protein